MTGRERGAQPLMGALSVAESLLSRTRVSISARGLTDAQGRDPSAGWSLSVSALGSRPHTPGKGWLMPRSQHLVAERVVTSYGAHRHAAPIDGARSPGTPSSTSAPTGPQQHVWTWRPTPDTGGSLDRA